jgi:hypothetical protein
MIYLQVAVARGQDTAVANRQQLACCGCNGQWRWANDSDVSRGAKTLPTCNQCRINAYARNKKAWKDKHPGTLLSPEAAQELLQ